MQWTSNLIKILFASFICLFSLAANADNASSLFRHSGDPVSGNAKGAITVAEFFDYDCPHCVNMVSTIHAIIAANPNVRFVAKELPVLGPNSVLAARAALAAKTQGKYNPFSQALFADSRQIDDATVTGIAKDLGLNVTKFKQDMNSNNVTEQLKANMALANQLGVPGTPAFFIGKTSATSMDTIQQLSGEVSQSELQAAIDKAKG